MTAANAAQEAARVGKTMTTSSIPDKLSVQEELIAEAEKYDPDDLPLQIKDLNQQITKKEEELSKLIELKGGEKKELKKSL